MKTIPHVPKEKTIHEILLKELVLHNTCQKCLLFSETENTCIFRVCPYAKQRTLDQNITVLEFIPFLVFETKNILLKKRLIELYKLIKGGSVKSMFRNELHKKAFNKQIDKYTKHGYTLSNRFIASLFVLTANSFLWNLCKRHIKPNAIDFSKIDVKGIKTDSYLLFKTAKDLYYKQHNVSVAELADKSITRDYILTIIVNGFLIARYGYKTLELELRPKECDCENK
ncbi:MAG: hypothetical protein K6C14_02465 [Eubacterium sp.]|nr:hypothetical protein [Eubacterium sp.]